MALTRSQARAFYDRFGAKQDSQAFYEDAALDELIAHAAFGQAQTVFELGCGTGRFAARLLAEQLPPTATYLGFDLSRTMVGIASQRLDAYADRARVTHSDGAMHFPLADDSVDRVIATYVLDLLPETEIRRAISEAHRVLAPGGRLCLISLGQGVTLPSHIVCALWSAVFRLHAALVGGCHPIRLHDYFDSLRWSVDYRHVLSQFGVTSEVLVATPRTGPENTAGAATTTARTAGPAAG
jgi:ubiquinone/menaquinone biosynthesis C-methylase UbiE